jgi:hypothetical protein
LKHSNDIDYSINANLVIFHQAGHTFLEAGHRIEETARLIGADADFFQ